MSYERLIKNRPYTDLFHLIDALLVEVEFANKRIASIEEFLNESNYVPLERTRCSKFQGYLDMYDQIKEHDKVDEGSK